MPLDATAFPTVVDAERHGVDPPYDYPDYAGTRLRQPREPLGERIIVSGRARPGPCRGPRGQAGPHLEAASSRAAR